jgi:D-3-phosphoglycerate dehydrogenase
VVVVGTHPGWDVSIEATELAKYNIHVEHAGVWGEDEIIAAAHDADGMLDMSAKITRRVMESLPKLRVIGRYGVGVDAVDVQAATELGIAVCNTPGFCVREVADHTLMFLLVCAKQLFPQLQRTRAGIWDPRLADELPSLWSQTLGLVAFGQIARDVAKRARTLGLRILAYAPKISQLEADPYGVRMVCLDDLLAESDYLSIHAPLKEETHHMLGEREFRLMKPTSFVLNLARGSLVDEGALIKALQEKWIAGAALDVFEQEPIDPTSPLLKMDNVIVTPHVAGASANAHSAMKARLGVALGTVLTGGWPARDLYNPHVKDTAHLRHPM